MRAYMRPRVWPSRLVKTRVCRHGWAGRERRDMTITNFACIRSNAGRNGSSVASISRSVGRNCKDRARMYSAFLVLLFIITYYGKYYYIL